MPAATLHRRHGLTLLEVLVLLAILAVLGALLVPAVQKAREASSCLKCANNLKGIGAAVSRYHDAHGAFPSGGGEWYEGVSYRPDGVPHEPPLQTGSWLYQVLPYLGHDDLYRSSDLTTGPAGNRRELPEAVFGPEAGNLARVEHRLTVGAVRGTPVPEYFCPSRRPPKLYRNGGSRLVAVNDYAAATPGRIPQRPDEAPPQTFWGDRGHYNGVITWTFEGRGDRHRKVRDERVTLADVTDGASTTLLAGEKFVPVNEYQGGHWGDDCGFPCGWDGETIRSTAGRPAWFPNPARDRVVNRGEGPEWWRAGYGFGSAHPGGINVVFADGSVRHILYGIRPDVFAALGHRSDGGGLSQSDF